MIKEDKLSQTLNRMFSLHPKLIDFDLSRLKLLMKRFNNPQNTLRNVIHIAGTNGKGSTASFLKEILEAELILIIQSHLREFPRNRFRRSSFCTLLFCYLCHSGREGEKP